MWVLNSRTPHSFSPVLCCQQNSSVVTFHIEILPTNIFKYKLFYDSIAHTHTHTTWTQCIWKREKKKSERRKNNEQTTQIGNFWLLLLVRCCMLSGVISMVIFMQISQMGFMVSIFSRLLAHAPSLPHSLYPSSGVFLLECVSNSFSCVCFRSSLLFCFSSCITVLPHRLRNGWHKNVVYTRAWDTIYKKVLVFVDHHNHNSNSNYKLHTHTREKIKSK